MILDSLKPLAVPLASLTPDPRNARVHPPRNLEALRTSLRAYGQRKPLVARRADRRIVAGNGLWQAAKDLGWTEIAVVFVEDDEATATGYALMDNQSALLAEWDPGILGDLVVELRAADFDLDLTGFDQVELDAFAGNDGAPVDAEPQIDRAEELRVKWGVETGQLWRLGEHRLFCGDSTKAEDVARCLNGAKPGLMVTDPPYGVNYDPQWRQDAAAAGHLAYAASRVGKVTGDDRTDWREAWELFPGDVVYSWHPAAGAMSIVHGQALEAAGFVLRMQIIWAKSNFPIGRGDYHVRHEPCWYAVRKARPSQRTDDRTQTTLWEINLDRNVEGGHSTQKPLECMARPIRNHDFPEVYDPFLGSGTTLIAAHGLGRHFFGIEIDPGYVAVALQRFKDSFGIEARLAPAETR